jgi:hypothetical protein
MFQLPNINTISLDLTARNISRVNAWLDEIVNLPLDDVPVATDHARLVSLVRRSSAPIAFRIKDDPRILCVWQSANTAAIVFTLWHRKLRFIDILLVDDTPMTRLPWPDLLSTLEANAIGRERRPLLVRCTVRKGMSEMPEILGIIAYMPAMCDLHGID